MQHEDLDKNWLAEEMSNKIGKSKFQQLIDITCVDGLDDALSEGYTSDFQRIKLTYGTTKGRKRKISFLLKIHKKESLGFSTDNKYETLVYSIVLDHMDRLMEKKEDKRGRLWPMMYGYRPYDVIMMENLRNTQFKMLNRIQMMDLDYALLVLKELGRFHAMSKILLRRKLIGNEFKEIFLPAKKNPYGLKFFESSLHVLTNCMIQKKGHWKNVSTSEKDGRLLKKKISSWVDEVDEAYCNYDEKFEVFNHGDCKAANMLFRTTKDEYTTIPNAVRLVDFQMSHVNSFMWDITFLLSISVLPRVRRAHIDQLLSAYWQSFSDNLMYFDWKDYVPTLEDVKNEYSRLSTARFLYVSTMLPSMNVADKDDVRFDRVLTHAPEEIFIKPPFDDDIFVSAYVEDLKEFSELGLI